MIRARTGEYRTITTTGEKIQAFVPDDLPPQPPIEWSSSLRKAHDRALASLARLDGVAAILPDAELFIYSYVRKEALLSSQIEGTQSTITDLFAFEAEEEVDKLPANFENLRTGLEERNRVPPNSFLLRMKQLKSA